MLSNNLTALVDSAFVWVRLEDSQSDGNLFLIDNGASISLLPTSLYEEIHPSQRPPLIPNRGRIESSNGTELGCSGIAAIKIKLGDDIVTHPFFVCPQVVHPILGYDFQRDQDLFVIPHDSMVYFKKKPIAGYDQNG